jgi:hypothetical protein
MKLFNLDLHISVIADVESIFKVLYGSAISITNWSLSGHNWIVGKADAEVEEINENTWTKINRASITRFQELYGEYLEGFDGFIVTHTPVFALLFEPFGKPILIVNSCRYDQPYCITEDKEGLKDLNESLQRMNARGQLTIVSNNAADYFYMKEGCGLTSTIIPSLCMYTESRHSPTIDKMVVFGDRGIFPPSDKLVYKPSLGYTWSTLFSYKGIIHCPYETSTMSIFEQFWAGVPLFFPTKRLYRDCIIDQKMNFASVYGGGFLTEEMFTTWIDRADYYIYPFINYYDTLEEAVWLAEHFVDSQREERLKWLDENRAAALKEWERISPFKNAKQST